MIRRISGACALIFTCSVLSFADGGAPEKPVFGQLSYTFDSHDNGAQIVIFGAAATKMFELLKKSAGAGERVLKDGKGISCFKEPGREIYCTISMTEEGVEDLLQIPDRANP